MSDEIKKFARDYLIINGWWILTVLIITARFGTWPLIIMGLIIFAFTYAEYMRFRNPKLLFVQRHRKIIDILYHVGFWGFLGITFWTSYKGFLVVSGNAKSSEHSMVFLILSLFLVAVLACTSYITKSRRSPKVLAIAITLFLFFDFAIAMPFNWMFFFDSYKGIDQVARDKKLIDTTILVSRARVNPTLDSIRNASNSVLNQLQTIENNAQKEADRKNTANLGTLLNLKQNNDSIYKKKINEFSRVATATLPDRYHTIKRRYDSTLKVRLSEYERYDSILTKCKTDLGNLLTEPDKEKSLLIATATKSNLRDLATSLKDTTLQSFMGQLNYREPTPLQLILTLQKYVLTGGDLPEYMEEFRPLVRMSLLTSIVIDILPLLLSLLFARYVRED